MKYKSILFICTGNACRSPMAEGILKQLVKNRDVVVRSAGIHAIEGFPPSENSVAIMKENGMDISQHKARSITKKILKESDLVLAMAPEHVDYIRTFYPKYFDKVYLLKKFGRENGYVEDKTVHDPIGGDESIYRECYDILINEVIRIASILFDENEDTEQ